MHALHRSGFTNSIGAVREPDSSNVSSPTLVPVVKAADTVSPEKVNAVTKRIRSFTGQLAERIDSHQTRIEAVSSSLNADELSTTSPVVLDAVEQLLSANELMRTELEETQQRLREQAVQLQTATQRAQTDALTGLSNRGTFDQRLIETHSNGARQAGVLVLLDIDHFKAFNDTHGHRCGDEVLRSVARMLEARLEPYGKVARFGGEEFAALIETDNFSEVVELVEKTRQAIGKREIRFEGQRLKVSMSAGMGRLGELESGKQQSSEQWLQQVDDALYRSKDVGRDCTHYFEGARFVRVGSSSKEAPVTSDITSTPAHSSSTVAATEGQAAVLASADQRPSIDDRRSNRVESRVSPPNLNQPDTESTIDSVLPAIETNQSPEDVETQQTIARLTQQLAEAEVTKPPKGLGYLPSLDLMIDDVVEKMSAQGADNRLVQLMVLTLSGSPRGATMRGLLQILRAALRSQDRIGCLNHSTLLVCLSECAEDEVIERAELICHSAGSVGVQLASKERSSDGERLSVGIVQLETTGVEGAPFTPAPESIEDAIFQARVTALRAGQQSVKEARLPVLTHVARVDSLALAY